MHSHAFLHACIPLVNILIIQADINLRNASRFKVWLKKKRVILVKVKDVKNKS